MVFVNNLGSGKVSQRPFNSPKFLAAIASFFNMAGVSKSIPSGGSDGKSLNGCVLWWDIYVDFSRIFDMKAFLCRMIQHQD
jgi:hypothetical protein